jgi:adenosylhomocysteine nucleosidase
MATSSVEERPRESASPVLIVAAMARELALLGGQPRANMALIRTGEGIRNAEQAVRSWLDGRAARAVLVIGFAGALSASLEAGDLVIAREVRGVDREGESFASSPTLLSAAEQARIARLSFGATITVDEIIGEASMKRQLANLLAQDEIGCVDMESSAVARVCVERGIPFLIARSITDLFDEDLPVDFNRCRTSDGSISAQRVIRAALMRPQSINGLLELRRRSDICAKNLASFVQRLMPLIK